MNYYTFLPQFHEPILKGLKESTIRRNPKVKVAEVFALRFWTGKPYASPMGVLGYARCTHVREITIADVDGMGVCAYVLRPFKNTVVFLDVFHLARYEGFSSFQEMVEHFNRHHGLPYKGWITMWEHVRLGPRAPEVPS